MGNSFEKSVFAKQWFESVRSTETEIELIRKGSEPIEKRHMLIKFKGASSGGIRSGSRNFVTGDRYALLIADDTIKNEADARSETIMGNIVTALTSDAKNAMRAKNTQFVIINTPFHKKDPIYTMIESGGFTPLVIPICKEISKDLKKSEFIGAWEDMHDYYSVMNRYLDAVATHSTRQFNQELMLRVSNEEDRLVTEEMLQWYDRPMLMKMLDGYSLYITTDFTTTGNALSDYSAISVWAVSSNFDYYLLDLSLKKLELEEQYNTVFRMVAVWGKNNRSIDVGVEVDGQQGAHVYSLKQKMLMTNRYFNFARQVGSKGTAVGIRSGSSGNKHERFRYIVPQFQNGKIYFPTQLKDTPDMKEALKQLKGVTVTGFTYNDDFCDTISQLALIDIIPGTGGDLSKGLDSNEIQMDMSYIWDKDVTDEDDDVKAGSTIF
jgi:phage terminase large subunit-like protein